MPRVGEIRSGKEIGFKAQYSLIWHACISCGKERWVQLGHGVPISLKCHRCAVLGSLNPSWKGGVRRYLGYICIRLPEHPYAYPNGYVPRARLVLEAKLGRYLLPDCIPHHINGIRDDDRPENLEEIKMAEHSRNHMLEIQKLKRASIRESEPL